MLDIYIYIYIYICVCVCVCVCVNVDALNGCLIFHEPIKPTIRNVASFRITLYIDEASTSNPPNKDDEHDTVGAVAVDCHGNVAHATSTGGISGKMCGRVVDSPVVG